MINFKSDFKSIVELKGFDLLSECNRGIDKVLLKCPNGHTFNIRASNFVRGIGCSNCSNKSPNQARSLLLNHIKFSGYKLLSDYTNAKSKITIECNNGHVYDTTPDSFKSGKRCRKCMNIDSEDAKVKFINLIKEEGYTLKSEYKGSLKSVNIVCPKGHDWIVRPSHFVYSYSRCPHCEGSTGQRLLQKMLLDKIPQYNVVYNDNKVLNGLELDIYYPKLKLAIEYQGNYYHNLPSNIERDDRKKRLCNNLNITLMEVWDRDFLRDPIVITNNIVDTIRGITI